MNTQVYHTVQHSYEKSIRMHGDPSRQFQAAVSHGHPMAFLQASGQHGEATCLMPASLTAVSLLAYPPQCGAHMHGIYSNPVMIPARLQPPQASMNYTWASPHPRWTEPQPVGILQQTMHHHSGNAGHPTSTYSSMDDMKPRCPAGHIESTLKSVWAKGQTDEFGHMAPEDTCQHTQRDEEEVPVDTELFPGCGPDFAKVSTNLLTG